MLPYDTFDKWMRTKRELTVKIIDKNHTIAEVKGAKVLVGVERNGSGYPSEFTILSGNTVVNIGDRYINCIDEYNDGKWVVYVDGRECYLFS